MNQLTKIVFTTLFTLTFGNAAFAAAVAADDVAEGAPRQRFTHRHFTFQMENVANFSRMLSDESARDAKLNPIFNIFKEIERHRLPTLASLDRDPTAGGKINPYYASNPNYPKNVVENLKDPAKRAKYLRGLQNFTHEPKGLWNAFAWRLLGTHINIGDDCAEGGYLGTYPLKIDGNDTTLHQAPIDLRQRVWGMMIETGFMNSDIRQGPAIYQYDATREVQAGLQAKPNAKTLVLGCGESIGELPECILPYAEASGAFLQTNCGHCQNTHNLPQELTVNADPTQLPTVLADYSKPEFWAAMPDGHWETIIDESFHNPFNAQKLAFVKPKLKQGGSFKIYQGIFSQEEIKAMEAVGFTHKAHPAQYEIDIPEVAEFIKN